MSLFKPENDSSAGRRCLKDEYKLCSVHSEVELSCVQNFWLFSCNNNDDKLCINVRQTSQTSQNVSLTLLSHDNHSDQLSHCLCHLDKSSRFLSLNSKLNFSPTFSDPFGCSRTAMDFLLSSFRILRISGRSFSTLMLSNKRILSEIFLTSTLKNLIKVEGFTKYSAVKLWCIVSAKNTFCTLQMIFVFNFCT